MKFNALINYTRDIDKTIACMEKAGFEKAVLCAAMEGMVVNSKKLEGCFNDDVYKVIKKYPDKFIGACVINPIESAACEKVKEYFDKGFRAVKLFPAEGYYPDDKRLYPFLSVCQSLGMVVIFHMGLSDYCYESDKNSRKAPNSSFAQPMKLDPICRLFPDIKFVVVNMGYPLLFECWSVFHNADNIYLHFGGSGVNFSAIPTLFVNAGGNGFIPLNFDKIIYGSAYEDNMLESSIIAKDYAKKMGASAEQAENMFNKNVEKIFG